MKKLFILSYLLFLISYSLFAQNVGIGTPTPNGNAMLDISSTSKGLLIPRLTTTQMNGIPAAVFGLLVYNTDSAAFAYANGSAWVYLKGNSTGSNDWSTKGNAGTNAATNFIGTTDNVNLIFKRNNIRAGLISFANISLGEQALNPATTGFFNIAFGEKAMYSNTTGSYNTATGYSALKDNTGGGGNTAAGMGALTKNVTGNNNTAIGASAMFTNSSGNDNTAVGFQSLFGNQISGYQNTALGSYSMGFNTTGIVNTAVGSYALNANAEGWGNAAIGHSAMYGNVSGYANVAMGDSTLAGNTTGSYNTAIGPYAGFTSNGDNNVFIGHQAGYFNNGSNKLYISNTFSDAANTLVYGEFDNKLLRSNGRLEINSDHTTLKGLQVIKNYNAGTNSNTIAVYGENVVDDNYGIGVQGKGGNTGVEGQSQVTGTGLLKTYTGVSGLSVVNNLGTNYGVSGQASGAADKNMAVRGVASGNSGEKYGVAGIANGTGINYAVYGEASGGSNDYAGYFKGKVYADNKIGIGIVSPGFPLEIKGISNGNDDLMKFYNSGGIAKWHTTLKPTGEFTFVETNVADNRLVLAPGGGVGVGKAPQTAAGNSRLQIKQAAASTALGIEAGESTDHWDFFVSSSNLGLAIAYNGINKGIFSTVDGSYSTLSDRRLKKDITTQLPVLNNVMQLQAYQYHYLDNQPTDRFSNGFMAQDVQKIFPDAVIENVMKDGEKRLGINYQYFTVLAIKGLQEQQQQVKSQEEKITMQEERIAKLEALVKAITDKK